ncbi:MAG: DUF5689 domain-containing protein [Alistipes putredinis]
MKKSSIWKLLFSALTVFAVAVFAGCTDDNDDMGAPYLNVTPENLTFDAEGQPADEYNGTFIVETNRPWRAIVEDEQTWVRLSATEGEGDAAVTVTVPASNIGQSAKVTFEVYNSYGALIQKDVNVLQGEVVPPTLIFNETAGSESVANPYPLVADYTGWNTTGEGASKVSYEGVNTSIRASGKSSAGAYDGASGPNVIFFGSAPATFTVKDITLASDQTNLKLTFGGQYYDGDNNDNNFNKDNFVVYLSANGTDYTPLSYEVNDGDQVDPYWVFATKNFTLKNATSTLYIKFEAKASSKFRLDDITLMTGNGGEEIDLAGGGVVPPDPSGDAIYENNFDKTPAEKVDNKWPFLDQTDAWQNASGTGNSTVTYTSANVSVRTSGKLSGGYDGASGSNKIFFGSAPATFDINTITMPAGKTNYRIIFGGAYSQSNGGTYDNIFKPESFHVAVGNGTDWSGNLTYEKIGGSDTTDPYWVQFAVDFTLKEAVGQLSIRFTADLASVFAIDDVQLVEGNGGQEVDLEGGVVPPDPGEATAITIPELIAQMTDTEAPVDANADRYLDAVVMNDVAGANYTFNNLILATENATEAGNGITLYGSQVEPSTLGLNKGDKVRVTLYKGLAKVVNYSGMYEVTGAKEATWCKVEKTLTVSVINQGDNQLSVSGLTPPLSATVDGLTVTVKADPNTGTQPVNQTLTITLANGNSKDVPVTLLGAGGGGTGEVVAFSITDIKADNADLPTNGYGSQVVATPSTWVSWTVGGIEFTGVKICESPASNGSIIQMQGNDSDAAKQAKLQNVTPIDGMSKIKIVFRSYPNKSGSYYNPGYTMTVAGAAQTPVETYTDKSGYREYVHEYDLAGLGADSFVLDNNKVGALYIESFEITK